MSRGRSWTDEDLRKAVSSSSSIRGVIKSLGLVPAGGNYVQVSARIKYLGLNSTHFKGRGWNKGTTYHTNTRPDLESILVLGSTIQSYKLKKRLYEVGLKLPMCELCGWAQKSVDGRVPLELDHINGNHSDNCLENLRVLCPNCHSLQPTHRGKNRRVAFARMS